MCCCGSSAASGAACCCAAPSCLVPYIFKLCIFISFLHVVWFESISNLIYV